MTESSDPTRPAAFSYPGHGPNARIGIAICHGFTGSPLSVLPWAAVPGRARLRRLGARSCPATEPTGRTWPAADGGTGTALSRARIEELAAGTDACYVAGLSMGGAIALLTASRHRWPAWPWSTPG